MINAKSDFYLAVGSETTSLTNDELRDHVAAFLDAMGPREDILLLPPDYTRLHSRAGAITQLICEHYGYIGGPKRHDNSAPVQKKTPPVPNIEILPALGTHAPMTELEIRRMYGDQLADKTPTPFVVHDWRHEVATIGQVPAAMVLAATRRRVDRPWPAQLNQRVWQRRHSTTAHRSLVISIGQIVPHEVMGMANFNKNLFIGCGGVEAINLSHFIGAVHGMENMMGRQSNPLRDILNYASTQFLEKELDLWYILTVVSADAATGQLQTRGLYIGRDIECYSAACDLSLKVNFTLLEEPILKCVVYLDEDEFHSTWLGNKSIYRTRMAMADGGELIILAPGVCRFGEDAQVDNLIRQHGYKGTPAIMQAMDASHELRDNLSAVAHLIHGSTEGRFRVTYCPGHLTKDEVEQVGFEYADLEKMQRKYNLKVLKDGWNEHADGNVFFISNPALGLWSVKSRFDHAGY